MELKDIIVLIVIVISVILLILINIEINAPRFIRNKQEIDAVVRSALLSTEQIPTINANNDYKFFGFSQTQIPTIDANNNKFFDFSRCACAGIFISVKKEKAQPHSAPYIVSFHQDGVHNFSGCILSKEHVLVPAHCIKNLTMQELESIKIVCGHHNNRIFDSSNVQIRDIDIDKIVIHEKYKPLFNEHVPPFDIAIVKLKQYLNFTKFVQNISIPKSGQPLPTQGTYHGWGPLNENNEYSDELRTTCLPILSEGSCKDMYIESDESEFCAGHPETYFCHRDSGSTLVSFWQGVPILIGILSRGKNTCQQGAVVFENISYHSEWIDSNINKIENIHTFENKHQNTKHM